MVSTGSVEVSTAIYREALEKTSVSLALVGWFKHLEYVQTRTLIKI